MPGKVRFRFSALLASLFAFLLIFVPAVIPQPGSAKEGHHLVAIDGAEIYFVVGKGELEVSRADLAHYVKDAARAVIAYYGYFPVQKAVVQFVPSDDDGIGLGTSTYNDDENYGVIVINIGESTNRRQLRDSWTLTHEFMHLGFPVVSHHSRWLAEGIATYVEPIGRMRIGNLSREEVCAVLLHNVHKGLPSRGDRGLHFSHNFDRVYWGGALYCLLADVEIRQRTNNRKGLEDALRSIAKQGGTAASDWDAEEAVVAGDKGIGVKVLQNLYEKMADKPVSIDVPSYLRKLGVVKAGTSVRFDENAPLAAVRRAIDGLDRI